MTKKFLYMLTLLVFCFTLLTGCTLVTVEPEATIPPGISKPEGKVVSTDPKIVEGRITKLTEDTMHISVQNVDWEFVLGEEALMTLEKFAEHDIEVAVGTFMTVYYEENEQGQRVAGRLERVTSN